MADQLVHRGPDDAGYCIKNEVGLAFRRLSIIDLANGNQPFCDETGNVVSICNGEIFNYRELRRELQAKGHQFRTECDVEVLIPLYKEYGSDFVKKLNGQFAFAIFDDSKKQLLLVRDHVGICPLFYTVAGDTLVFGSEIKAILKHPAVSRAVNLRGLDQILTFPGMASPTTMFAGIHSVRPGHQLIVKTNGRLEEKEYWDLDYPLRVSEARSEADYVDELDEVLCRAVKDRLNADVPVGYYLSGGLDSCLIGSIAQRVLPDPQRPSFSIAFADQDHDERAFQRVFTGHVPSVHHQITFDWNHVAGALERAVYHSEAPLKESYNTCSLALSERVRQSGVKVVLTGEGADELFAGYVGYRFDAMRSEQSHSSELNEVFESEERQRLWGNKEFFYEKDYAALKSVKSDLFGQAAIEHIAGLGTADGVVNKTRLRGRHLVHQRSYVDFKLRLSDHLLADHGDRVAYANSIEARYPFLDTRVIDLARRMPPKLKLNGLIEKYIVKQVAARYLPGAITGREKFHFVAPGSPALLAQNIEWINDLLSFEKIKRQGYFNPATVERLRKTYNKPGFKLNLPFDSDLLMIVITFGIFLDLFGMPNL